MELRVEVADATGLMRRLRAAVSEGKIAGWRLEQDRLVTSVRGTDVAFAASLDLSSAPVRGVATQVAVYRADGSAPPATLSDAITRLELAIRHRFVTPQPDAEPIDDYGTVIAEFVIRD